MTQPIINNNVSQTDLMYFKEEILGNIKQMDNKMNEKIDQIMKIFEAKIAPYQSKFDEMSNKIFDLSNLISNDKTSMEKITKLYEFRVKIEEEMQSAQSKINQCNRDISNACYKYDKVLLDNFLIPGLLGPNCKYPTLKAYIENSINQISNLNSFKDRQSLDLKSYKDKLEQLIKQFGTQIEKVKANFLDYCKESVDNCENRFNERIKSTDDRIELMRVENGKYAIDLKQQSNDLGIQWEKILKIKEEIFVKFDEEVAKFEKLHTGTENTMDEYKKEFKLIKKKFTELSEFIKDVRFRKNIGGDVKKRELREMSDKINFDKKQKYQSSDDSTLLNKSSENISTLPPPKFKSPTIIPKKSAMFSEDIPLRAPFSPQIKQKKRRKMLEQESQSSISRPVQTEKPMPVHKPMENLDQIESTVKQYINPESQKSADPSSNQLPNIIQLQTGVNGDTDGKDDSINNIIIPSKKNKSKINLYNLPVEKEPEKEPEKEQEKEPEKEEVFKNEPELTATKQSIDFTEQNKYTSIDEVKAPIIEKEENTIELQNNIKIEGIVRNKSNSDIGNLKLLPEVKTRMQNKNVILSPLHDSNFENVFPQKINESKFTSTTAFFNSKGNQTLEKANKDLLKKLLKAESKISAIERNLNKKIVDIFNQLTHLNLQIKLQSQNSSNYVRDLKINYISSSDLNPNSGTYSPNNDLNLLSPRTNDKYNNFYLTNENISTTNANFYNGGHKKNYSLYMNNRPKNKRKNKGSVVDNDFSKSQNGPTNRFSPLSVLINNEPKYLPRDESNVLLRNIEPFLIKKFDDDEY